jgi:hypothetical protein
VDVVLGSFMNSDDSYTSARRFAVITEALCRAVGNAIARGFITVAMAIVVCRRIQGVRSRLLARESRFLAGTLRTEVTMRAERAVVAGATRPLQDWLPRRFAWLCVMVPSEAASYASQLRVVLADPDMVALLGSCPQAVKIVRPLCRMLGIAPEDFMPRADRPLRVDAVKDEPCPAPSPAVVAAFVPAPACPAQVMVGLGWLRFIPG